MPQTINRREFLKRLLLATGGAALGGCLSPSGSSRNTVRITLLHVNDLHGALRPKAEEGGAANLVGLIERTRADAPSPILLLDAGDAFQGTYISNSNHGQAVMEVMNLAGVDAFALGNHEFDWGLDVLRARIAEAQFPCLAANLETSSGKMLEDVNPVGGSEKAEAIKKSCERTGIGPENVIYAGDSITDMEAMKLVRNAGGIAVSFNGNRYAIRSADVACLSPNALILAALALRFKEDGAQGILDLASEWETRRTALEIKVKKSLPVFSVEDTSMCLIADSHMGELSSRSESFRRTVRGERIGLMG